MKYPTLIVLLLWTFQITHAIALRTFRNEADKKVRLTLWYKRYNTIEGDARYEKRMHRYITYIKPNELKRITLREKKYDDLKICYLMATNTRRRNDWDGLTSKDIEHTTAFTILYDEEQCFKISPSSRITT